MSCWLYPYSLYLLLGMFILLGLEFRLRRQRMKTGTATLSGWPKWKYFLLSEKDPLPLESLLSSLGRLLFFLALGSQLVWLWFQEGCV
ncbi:MAG: hypothetical protein KZQ58_11665 [gamma proteobacterium symbiont of Bathyaustriella thionipta]|nr:hypothetical protein [gamma proteobacterium symbiont of Bathyaustriella thionipta]